MSWNKTHSKSLEEKVQRLKLANSKLREDLKAKDDHIVELNKMVQAKEKEMEIIELRAFCNGYNSSQKGYFGLRMSRSIVAMLFWEWRKAKIVVKKHEQKGEDVSYGKTVMYAREQMFRKAYAMLKDKQNDKRRCES